MLNNSKKEPLKRTYGDHFIDCYNNKGYSIEQIAIALEITLLEAKRLKKELNDKLISPEDYQEKRKKCINEEVKKAIEEGKSLDELEEEIARSFNDKRYFKRAIKEILRNVYTKKIKVLYEKGDNISVIAKKLKISSDIVKTIFQRLEYIKYYNEGYNRKEIEKKLNISPEDCGRLIDSISSYEGKEDAGTRRKKRKDHIIDIVKKGREEQASYIVLLSELCIESIAEKEIFFGILKDYYNEEYIKISEEEKKTKTKTKAKTKKETNTKTKKIIFKKGSSKNKQQIEQKQQKKMAEKLKTDKQSISNAVYKFFLNRIQSGEIIPENIYDLNIEFIAKSKIKKSKSGIQLIVDSANGITEKEKETEKETEPKITVIRFLKYNDPEYKTIVQETYKHVQELLTTFEDFKDNNKENTHLTLADRINNMSLQDRFFVTINLKLWLNKVKLESLETVQLKAIKDIIDRLPKQNKSLDSKGDDKNRIKISDTFKTIENMLSEFSTKILKVIEERNNLIR